MSTDKPTYEERLASTKPGCKCELHCQHVWGDQAPTAEEHEIIDLRRQLAAAKEACGYYPPSQTLAERIAEIRDAAEHWDSYLDGDHP